MTYLCCKLSLNPNSSINQFTIRHCITSTILHCCLNKKRQSHRYCCIKSGICSYCCRSWFFMSHWSLGDLRTHNREVCTTIVDIPFEIVTSRSEWTLSLSVLLPGCTHQNQDILEQKIVHYLHSTPNKEMCAFVRATSFSFAPIWRCSVNNRVGVSHWGVI